MKTLFFFLLLIYTIPTFAQEDSTLLKVHFLYGSKPNKKYRNTERKWFGGVLGGHVGIENSQGKVIDFLPNGRLHIFASKKHKHSVFVKHSPTKFLSVFGGNPDAAKFAIISIPISARQRLMIDSITKSYLDETPYDYAFFGMRCGSSSYEILAQAGILKAYKQRRTIYKIFYPKKLRKRLLKLAAENNWAIERQKGSSRRRWEKDKGEKL